MIRPTSFGIRRRNGGDSHSESALDEETHKELAMLRQKVPKSKHLLETRTTSNRTARRLSDQT